MDYLCLNQKTIAAELAARRRAEVEKRPVPDAPAHAGLTGKVCTQADMESDWLRYWLAAMRLPFTYWRKLWEYAFVCQALWEAGMMAPGRRGLGLGCGSEPLPSFLVSRGCDIAAGDQPPERAGANRGAWFGNGIYTESAESLFKPEYVDRAAFDARFKLCYVDMNAVPAALHGQFDFCWSVCTVEHLGSIDKGLAFLRESPRLLKPGGISVHTTEFNYLDTARTIDHTDSVLFKREHFEAVADALRADGCTVRPMNFDPGAGVFDHYIDLPPYGPMPINGTDIPSARMTPSQDGAHLKFFMEGLPSTCFAFIAVAPA